MSIEYICDGCGKREPAQNFANDSACRRRLEPEGWRSWFLEGRLHDTCSDLCYSVYVKQTYPNAAL